MKKEKQIIYEIKNSERIKTLLKEILLDETSSKAWKWGMNLYIEQIINGNHTMPDKILGYLLTRIHPAERKHILECELRELSEPMRLFEDKEKDEEDEIISHSIYIPFPANTSYDEEYVEDVFSSLNQSIKICREKIEKLRVNDVNEMLPSYKAILGDLLSKLQMWQEWLEEYEGEEDDEETEVYSDEDADFESDDNDEEDDENNDSEIEETLLEKIEITSENGLKIIDFDKGVKLELRDKNFRSLEKFLKSGKPEKIKLMAKLKWKMLSLSVKIQSNMVYFRFLTFNYKLPLSSILPFLKKGI